MKTSKFSQNERKNYIKKGWMVKGLTDEDCAVLPESEYVTLQGLTGVSLIRQSCSLDSRHFKFYSFIPFYMYF